MNRDDIIRMAREAGLTSVIDAHHKEYGSGAFDLSLYEEVTRFAALVAAAEREACAKVCDGVHARHIAEYGDYLGESYATMCAEVIRARGNT